MFRINKLTLYSRQLVGDFGRFMMNLQMKRSYEAACELEEHWEEGIYPLFINIMV
ncbi:hypothetical protein [Paenibacillus taiwanensis]|uniref:hypothetical protein n=1 Tax=Paenibacillus taiwanensis TaxID=401638 RepID=UPI0003F5796C|nr:hypothetical protein [Paenibacillus taiwanensis]